MSIRLKLIKRCAVSDDWIKWLNDKDVTKYSENRLKKHSKVSQRKFLKKKLKDKNSMLFKIFFKNEHIGVVELSNINYYHKHCELMYMIGKKKYWNQGIGKIVIKLIDSFYKNVFFATFLLSQTMVKRTKNVSNYRY